MKYEHDHHLLQELAAAQSAIADHDQECSNDPYRCAYVVGVLRSTLEGMAGLNAYGHHASCFSPEVTSKVRRKPYGNPYHFV
jgi:hypothetical protein